VAVTEPLRRQHPAHDDHRGPPDAGREHLRGDIAEGAAQHDLVLLAGEGHHRRRALGPVVRRQLGDHLLDPLDGQVQHQRRPGRAQAGQVLARRHGRRAVRDPGEDDRLPDARHGELAPQGRRGRRERGHARGYVVADAGLFESARLLGNGAEDRRVARAEPDHVKAGRVRLRHRRDDLVQGQVGGVDQPGIRRAVREDLGRDEAPGIQAHRALRQQALRPDGDQVSGAGACTDEMNGHSFSFRRRYFLPRI
jgi:hypothetical protein